MTKAADALHRPARSPALILKEEAGAGLSLRSCLPNIFHLGPQCQRDVESGRFDVREEFVSGGRLKRGPLRGLPLALCSEAQSQELACATRAAFRRRFSLRSRRRG